MFDMPNDRLIVSRTWFYATKSIFRSGADMAAYHFAFLWRWRLMVERDDGAAEYRMSLPAGLALTKYTPAHYLHHSPLRVQKVVI